MEILEEGGFGYVEGLVRTSKRSCGVAEGVG